jgi:hypothetical protein
MGNICKVEKKVGVETKGKKEKRKEKKRKERE